MKKLNLFIILLCTFCFAQNSSNKINESKSSTINRHNFEKICINISKIFEEYDCKRDLNRKVKIVNQKEVLFIQLKSNKIKLDYNSLDDRGVIYSKFQDLIKFIDE